MVSTPQPTPLLVNYKDKDKVKSLGARWDNKRKIWYIPTGLDTTPFKEWMHPKGKVNLQRPQKSLLDEWVWDQETIEIVELLEKEAMCHWALMCLHESTSPMTVVKRKRRHSVIASESEDE